MAIAHLITSAGRYSLGLRVRRLDVGVLWCTSCRRSTTINRAFTDRLVMSSVTVSAGLATFTVSRLVVRLQIIEATATLLQNISSIIDTYNFRT